MTSPFSVPNSLVVGLFVLGVFISCYNVNGAVPPRTREYSKENELEPITLEDFLQNKLGANSFVGQWADGSDNLIRIKTQNEFIDYNIDDGTNGTALNLTEIRDKLPLFTGNLIFSNDGNFALVEHDRTNLWRYSTLAKYDIYDLNTKQIIGQLNPPNTSVQVKLQLVKWAPTGHGIVFVYQNNIYYRKDAAPLTLVRQITADGTNPDDDKQAVYNGIADWVYEEEMFGGPNALWISKSGNNLAFVKFNDTKVTEFQWPIYGEPGSNQSYPEYRKIRYPKAGTTNNPDVTVFTVSLADENTQPALLTYAAPPEVEYIVGTVEWATDNNLLVATLNRVQTSLQWHLCTVRTPCRQIYNYTLEHGWVDMNTPKISKDGTKFLWIRSLKLGFDNESYNRIVMFRDDGSSMPITTGRLSVSSILGWNEAQKKVFFSGSLFNEGRVDPTQTHVYSVSDDGQATTRCITCNLQNSNGSDCKQNSVTFSANFVNFIHRCAGPDVPETTTRKTADATPVANPGPTFIDNSNVRELISKKAVPITKEYNVTVGEGFEARAWLWFPADYDESKKYPLLISVYGGPGSQNLVHNYGITWETSLVSSKNIIVGKIDGRGTAKRSSEHLFTLHRNLGSAEIDDQISVTKWLIDRLPIDANATSIWGWSYGGYATAKVLEKDTNGVFKCGISVAPVTNWMYYDTIYTERYMGLPNEDNYKGYNESDVTTHVENIRNKQFMLVHGNADDNVHYQQSMILARSLEKNDIFFHQLSYPDENHGIGGMRQHLYHSLERFLFDECYRTERSTRSNADTQAKASVLKLIALCAVLVFRHHAF